MVRRVVRIFYELRIRSWQAVLHHQVGLTFERKAEVVEFQIRTNDVARTRAWGKLDRYYVRISCERP